MFCVWGHHCSRHIVMSVSQARVSREHWGQGAGSPFPSRPAVGVATPLVSLTRDPAASVGSAWGFLFLRHCDGACWFTSLVLCCLGAQSPGACHVRSGNITFSARSCLLCKARAPAPAITGEKLQGAIPCPAPLISAAASELLDRL